MSPKVKLEYRIIDIVHAAIKVFSRKGFRQAQMDEIAREARVSKGTLYNYFKSKAHLFYYVLENGSPEEASPLPAPSKSLPKTERDLLRLTREGLRRMSRFQSIEAFLNSQVKDIDIAKELSEILNEWWDMCESNRFQIIILERSIAEFPQLAQVFNQYARKHILGQFERYLETRVRAGVIQPLHSPRAAARFILESVSWFGWKQHAAKSAPLISKSEAIPDVLSILQRGLSTENS